MHTFPPTLTLQYDPSLVGNPERLEIYHFDSATNSWQPDGGQVDIAAHTIT